MEILQTTAYLAKALIVVRVIDMCATDFFDDLFVLDIQPKKLGLLRSRLIALPLDPCSIVESWRVGPRRSGYVLEESVFFFVHWLST